MILLGVYAQSQVKLFIIGTVYAKLNYSNAVSEILALIDSASKVAKERKAGGIILMGDFNARHPHWGDKASNEYGS